MKAQKRGLGRGLEALLADTTYTETAAPESTNHPVNALSPNPVQDNLWAQHRLLMQEAEDLKSLLDELVNLLNSNSN